MLTHQHAPHELHPFRVEYYPYDFATALQNLFHLASENCRFDIYDMVYIVHFSQV